mmetsp:Transcript_72848/g.173553  ORF Transcript_72848/g.173553 Transcript_72848/m.173553 type:complete len:243 (+) Transcript_72848:68-796(+)
MCSSRSSLGDTALITAEACVMLVQGTVTGGAFERTVQVALHRESPLKTNAGICSNVSMIILYSWQGHRKEPRGRAKNVKVTMDAAPSKCVVESPRWRNQTFQTFRFVASTPRGEGGCATTCASTSCGEASGTIVAAISGRAGAILGCTAACSRSEEDGGGVPTVIAAPWTVGETREMLQLLDNLAWRPANPPTSDAVRTDKTSSLNSCISSCKDLKTKSTWMTSLRLGSPLNFITPFKSSSN